MPHTINDATPVPPSSYGYRSTCADLSKRSGSKYWTLLQNTTCLLYNEFLPISSNDKSVTGSQACSDFYNPPLLTLQGPAPAATQSRKKRSTNPSIAKPPNIDLLLNPMRQAEENLMEAYMTNITRTLFNPPLPRSSYPHLFRLLRHTNLPCLPSGEDQDHMILRCMFSGQKVDCAKIFTPVPTDYGMCCAFNPRTILREEGCDGKDGEDLYACMVKKLQLEESQVRSLGEETRKATNGAKLGLQVILDQHSNLDGVATHFDTDNSFKVYVGQPSSFPMLNSDPLTLGTGKIKLSNNRTQFL